MWALETDEKIESIEPFSANSKKSLKKETARLAVSITCLGGLIEEVVLELAGPPFTQESKDEKLIHKKLGPYLDVQITGADLKLKDALIEWLQSYINKKPTPATLPYNFQNLTAFERSVLYAIEKIPFGEVKTYKEIAEDIEKPQAARAVGMACGKNPFPLFIPCHRVVASSGEGGYTPDIAIKRFFLKHEGAF